MTSTERDLPEVELRKVIDLADRMGASGSHPSNIYRVAERAADALASIRAERDAAVAATIEQCAKIADQFTCGACGMDGKAAAAIRAALTVEPEAPDNAFAEYEGVTAKELAETVARYGKVLSDIATNDLVTDYWVQEKAREALGIAP